MKKLIVGKIRKGHETNRVVIGRANAVKLKEYYITKVNGTIKLLQRTLDGLVEPDGLLSSQYLYVKGLIRSYAKVINKLPGITLSQPETSSVESELEPEIPEETQETEEDPSLIGE